MSEREPHAEALDNIGRAYMPEGKIRYPSQDPNKRRAFEALGFGEETGNWRELRNAIGEGLPFHPARFSHRDEWGTTYDVDMDISGTKDKQAPVRTKWIYRTGENFPRIVTLYVKTTEWRRRERNP